MDYISIKHTKLWSDPCRNTGVFKLKHPVENGVSFENSNHRFYYYGKIDIVKEGVGV